ncbi:MAG TPA: SAM-dependent methyltransferase, partial [Planctomycetes bacterium]|nr:SAM-dependent methyltransferase [Planctomycetota bacterium]
MNSPKDDYLLRTDPEELSRMKLQHSLWRPVAIHLWDAAEIKEGMRVLDLGCGPG